MKLLLKEDKLIVKLIQNKKIKKNLHKFRIIYYILKKNFNNIKIKNRSLISYLKVLKINNINQIKNRN